MRSIFLTTALCLLVIAPTGAANVNLQANLVNSCVLSLGSNGALTASAAGTQLGSENAGGSAATLTLVGIGTLPTISFAAPSLTTSPSGWSESHTQAIRYTSTRGANQAYTAAQSSVTAGGLTDTFTIHGKVDSSAGFAAGNYTLTTVVTCSQ